MQSDAENDRLDKKNKPLMEKLRRARINRSLSQLKQILIQDKHGSSGHAKWEKADVLEMTVDYIKQLRERLHDEQKTSSPSPNPPKSEELTPTVMQQMMAVQLENNFKMVPFLSFPLSFQWPPA